MEVAMKKERSHLDSQKATFASAKSGELQRRKAGKINTAKLPRSLEELRDLLKQCLPEKHNSDP
jgi:hypothetical protein